MFMEFWWWNFVGETIFLELNRRNSFGGKVLVEQCFGNCFGAGGRVLMDRCCWNLVAGTMLVKWS